MACSCPVTEWGAANRNQGLLWAIQYSSLVFFWFNLGSRGDDRSGQLFDGPPKTDMVGCREFLKFQMFPINVACLFGGRSPMLVVSLVHSFAGASEGFGCVCVISKGVAWIHVSSYVEEADWHQGCMAARLASCEDAASGFTTNPRASFNLPPFFSFHDFGMRLWIPAPIVAELYIVRV